MSSLNLHGHRHIALLLLRIAVGAVFVSAGMGKFAFLTGEASMPGLLGSIMPVLAVVETLCGALVILGAFAALNAAVLGIVMIGALYVHISGGDAFAKWQIVPLLLSACAVVLTVGPGNLSVDAWRKKA